MVHMTAFAAELSSLEFGLIKGQLIFKRKKGKKSTEIVLLSPQSASVVQ